MAVFVHGNVFYYLVSVFRKQDVKAHEPPCGNAVAVARAAAADLDFDVFAVFFGEERRDLRAYPFCTREEFVFLRDRICFFGLLNLFFCVLDAVKNFFRVPPDKFGDKVARNAVRSADGNSAVARYAQIYVLYALSCESIFKRADFRSANAFHRHFRTSLSADPRCPCPFLSTLSLHKSCVRAQPRQEPCRRPFCP